MVLCGLIGHLLSDFSHLALVRQWHSSFQFLSVVLSYHLGQVRLPGHHSLWHGSAFTQNCTTLTLSRWGEMSGLDFSVLEPLFFSHLGGGEPLPGKVKLGEQRKCVCVLHVERSSQCVCVCVCVCVGVFCMLRKAHGCVCVCV